MESTRTIRPKLVVGNWKMSGSHAQLIEIEAIEVAARAHADVDIVICLPFTMIDRAASGHPALAIGAQDCHEATGGAYTGSVSAPMLRESGASHVIVGHSERRSAHGETDAVVRSKADAAIGAGLVALICVGEDATERRLGEAERIVMAQVAGSVPQSATAGTVIIAYEPVWAIGQGRTPDVKEIASTHAAIRQALAGRLGEAGADVRILYGGSVTAENAGRLLAIPEVDGALVGGASLTAAQFVPIIEAAADRASHCEVRRREE
jgi:triosephosphate isomerase